MELEQHASKTYFLLDTFECNQGSVLSLVARRTRCVGLRCGGQDKCVTVWVFERKSHVRPIMAQEDSVILYALSVYFRIPMCWLCQ